ncbi:MAG: insulinase family protein [Deltaproteobacteria bacterium]|nr:insulinase family protein [Deltaproteobacteria bacterium]
MPLEPHRLVRYPNGFELLLVPSRTAPVLALDLWVRAGSACERNHEAGIAHFVEHMLFKGTARRPPGALAREVEGVGGEINAYTSSDHTVYSLAVASRFADLAVDLLSDAVLQPSFDPSELEREKSVVLEEIKRSLDLPQHYLSQLLFAQAYRVHPYGLPVIGNEDTVASFSRTDCVSFTARWYRPGAMTLVAAGDADLDRLERLVGESFGRAPRALSPPRSRRRREPLPSSFRVEVEPRDVQEVYFDLAFPGPAASDPDVAAVDVLMALLGQGEASRLQHRVKLDRNLVRAVGAGAYTPVDPGLLSIGAVVDPPLFAEAYRAICDETFRLCVEPVGVRELERAKDNLEADFIYQKETVQGQAQKAGFFHVVLGDAGRERDYVEAVRRVDAEAVRAAAGRHLQVRRGVLAALHPRGRPLGWSAEELASLTAETQADARHDHRPPRRSGRARRPRLTRLPNGVRLLVKINPDVPVVALRAALLGGSRREDRRLSGLFHLTAEALVHGTRSRNVFEIAHEADDLAGQLDPFSGRNSFGLKAELLAKYLEDGLDLFADVLCHPTFPADEVDKVREDTLGALRLRADNPAAQAFRLFEETLYLDHPYGRDVLGTPETVGRISPADLRRTHAAFTRPEHLVVAVAGDVDPDLVADFFAHALGHLAPGASLPPEPPPPRRVAEPRRASSFAPTEQAHVVAGFLGASLRSVDRFGLRVANAVLAGQGGRLFRRLRDERGLAYSVSSSTLEGLDRGYVAGYIATNPAQAEAAREGLLAEFQSLARGEVTAEEIEEAKRKLVGGFEIALQENVFQAAQMAMDEVYGLGGQGFASHARQVFAVSTADVVAAARRYFDPSGLVSVFVGPEPPTS